MPTPLPTPKEMAHWDRQTIDEFGLSAVLLMENASRAAMHVLSQTIGSIRGRTTVIFAGSGNNGGDAFALARHMANLDAKVLILYAKNLEQYSDESAYHLRLAQAMGISCAYLPEYELDLLPSIDIVVDGLLGTGFEGELRPDMQRWIKRINKLGNTAFVLSLDIPSGLNGATGHPMPVAVRANMTVCFEETKLGLALPPARDYVGHLQTVQIGIPMHIKDANPTRHTLLASDLAAYIPEPGATIHKGSSGHVLVLGGSSGMTGAPLLAARAAIRSGAGLVTLGTPKGLTPAYGAFPEIMTLGLGQDETWSSECMTTLSTYLSRFSAIIFGPGFGRGSGQLEFLKAYLQSDRPKTVFDADALYLFAQHPELLDLLGRNDVLTPHPGEMGHFHSVSGEEINQDRIGYANDFSTRHDISVVLKGAGTIVAGPDEPIGISPFSEPNLAVAGSGDVLAGIIGGLVARGLAPLTAAQVGVYWHGHAGKVLARDFPYRGNTPLEIADALPIALKEWKECAQLETSCLLTSPRYVLKPTSPKPFNSCSTKASTACL